MKYKEYEYKFENTNKNKDKLIKKHFNVENTKYSDCVDFYNFILKGGHRGIDGIVSAFITNEPLFEET